MGLLGEFAGTSRFHIRRRLGAGGMGIVYEAYDVERKAPVAVKALRALDENSLARFKNEFRSLADLTHPNLVRLGELYCEGNQWFFTMDLVEGEHFLAYIRGGHAASQPLNATSASSADLETASGRGLPPQPSTSDSDEETVQNPTRTTPVQRRPQSAPFDEVRLRNALRELAVGVAALHRAGKVHRDIKPSNVLVMKSGRAVVLDFGLVTDAAGAHSTELNVVGTVSYMAPEQAAGRRVGPEADWYAVGSVLYQALTGRTPYDGSQMEVLFEKRMREPLPPHTWVNGLPEDLCTLCMELLRIEPGQRPSGEEILRRLGTEAASVPLERIAQTSGPFIGRKRELGELEATFGEAEAGNAATVLVHGESGIGKSALVRRFLDGVAARGALVLAGRCYERERVPFKAFDGIVDALSRHLARIDQVAAAFLLPRDAALLARVFPILRRVPAMAQAIEPTQRVQDPLEIRIRAFAALRDLLTRLVERAPLVLFIDDLQWADVDSLALLGELMHPPGAPPLLLVATLRTGVAQVSLEQIEAAIGQLRHVHLERLSPAEGQELARLLTEADGAADRIAAEAEGHPLFIQELVRHVEAAGSHAPGSIRLDDALWDRVLKLEAQDRTLLEVLAVAGAPIAQQVAAAASGAGLAELIARVTPLRTAHLVRTGGARGSDLVEPYHDRIREAVLARLSGETRVRHHALLAQALEIAGAGDADPRALMRHFQGAGDARRAGHYAERAARLAETALAFDQAAELLRVALAQGEHGDAERSRLHMQLGDALANSGRGREAADAYLAALPGADAGSRLEAQRRAAEQLLISGHIDRGLQTLAAVLTEIGVQLPRSRQRALLSLLVQRVKLRLRGLRWTRRDASEIAQRDLVRLDVYKAVAMSLALVDNIRGADFQARGLLLALASGEPQRVGRSFALEAIYQATQGRRTRKRADQLIGEVRSVAEATGDPQLHGWVYGSSGLVAYLNGEFRAGAQRLRECEQIFREQTTGTSSETSNACVLRLLAFRFMGSFRELRAEFDRYVRDAGRRGDRFAETTLTRACNQVWLVDDNPELALRELDAKSWTPPEGGYHMQHFYELRARIEVALYTGTVAAQHDALLAGFAPLRTSLLLRIQTIRCESYWLRARLALANGKPREAARQARKLEREGVDYAQVWAELIRAAIERSVDRLRALPERAEKLDLLVCAAAARMRLAELLGDTSEATALRAHATDWMRTETVKEPARIVEMIAPGFS